VTRSAGYRGVLLDLFGTLIGVDEQRLPELRVEGRALRTTVGGLAPLLERWLPGTPVETFWGAFVAVSEEMVRARATSHVELPSRERFRRVLARLGCERGALAEAAVQLSRAHLAMIAAATVLPPAHRTLLAALRRGHRVGLVSNFDDTGTAYEILARHDVLRLLDTVVVSEALGLRKPHPAPIRAALAALELAADEVLFVGDTFAEDVAGARAAGVDAAWIDARGAGCPTGDVAPRHVVRRLPEVAAIVGVALRDDAEPARR